VILSGEAIEGRISSLRFLLNPSYILPNVFYVPFVLDASVRERIRVFLERISFEKKKISGLVHA
jgi:hypothetical protein